MGNKLTPLNDRIIVRPIPEDEVTKSGLFIPESAKEKPSKATVVAVGDGRYNDAGIKLPMRVKEGDSILYSKYAGTAFKDGDVELLILGEEDVFGILAPEQAA